MNNSNLIVTVAVIIILSSIVIFTGLDTPDSAQFSAFCNDVDSVYMNVMDKYGNLKADHAINGDYRTNEQIYIEIATGTDPGQYSSMGNNYIKTDAINGIPTGDGIQLIKASSNAAEGKMKSGYSSTGNNESLIKYLPQVRGTDNAWYVTEDGRIFNATGHIYDDKTYFNASFYAPIELSATDSTEADRAQIIWDNGISIDSYSISGLTSRM